MTPPTGFLLRDQLDDLIAVVSARGFACLGPQVKDGAIVYDTLKSSADLPAGVHVDQQPGCYTLTHTYSERQFAWSNGPQAIKPLVFAPTETLWHVQKTDDGTLQFSDAQLQIPAVAIFGVKGCDLAALALQDKHFMLDPCYAGRRQALFLIAVNCTHPAATCFCASTGDGPSVKANFDLLLDELDDGFLVNSGSDIGNDILTDLALTAATDQQKETALQAVVDAADKQQRRLPPGSLYKALFDRLDHPHWKEIGERCLSCGNCTAVCPTCFCSRETDSTLPGSSSSSHTREWDSCFTQGHSYIHGLTIRPTTKFRYRQWLTHKLGSWHEQYGRSGCTGCGRCISWCPVGIDLTVEVATLLATEQ